MGSLQVLSSAPRRQPRAPRRVALAYSGGLLASCMIPWLKAREPGCDVVAVAVNVGQIADPAPIIARAEASGAAACIVVDAQTELLRDVALPTLRAGAIHERKYRLGVAMARPVIAAHQVAVARREGCATLAHGATRESNDRARFELAYQALAPDLAVVAPRFDWPLHSRDDAVPYALRHGVPVPAPARSAGGNVWQAGHSADERPIAAPAAVTLTFEQGWPVALDGERLELVDLQRALNVVGAAHRLGSDDLCPLRVVGRPRARGAAPGGALLMTAHRALEEAAVDVTTLRLKDLVAEIYADVVYNGQWFSPLREALDAFVHKTQAMVTGEIRLNLYNGTIAVARQSLAVAPVRRATAGWSPAPAGPVARDSVARFAEIEQFLAGGDAFRLVEMMR